MLLSVNTQAQNTSVNNDNSMVRAVMGFNEVDFTFRYETPTATAYSNLLIKAFNNMLPLPVFDFSLLPAKDRENLELLRTQLISLRNNPPTWEEITTAEVARVKLETAPPTAPVYAGSDAANTYYKTIKNKNAVKHNSVPGSKYVDQKQDNGVVPVPVPVEPKTENQPIPVKSN